MPAGSRDLGGGRVAQLVSGLCVLIAPVFLRTAKILHVPAFEPVFWLGAALLVTRLLRGGDPRLWLAVGVTCGVGLLNKPTMALFALGLAVGLLLTPAARRHLAEPWLWAGLTLSAVIFAPKCRGGALRRDPKDTKGEGYRVTTEPTPSACSTDGGKNGGCC